MKQNFLGLHTRRERTQASEINLFVLSCKCICRKNQEQYLKSLVSQNTWTVQ